MAEALIYQIFSSSALVLLGLYHMVGSARLHLKSPQTYSAKPFHPFPPSSSHSRLKHLQLYLVACLLIATAHHCLSSLDSDPLIKGHSPVHHFTSLQSASICFLFFLLSLTVLLSDSFPSLLPLPTDLFFALAATFFFLLYSNSSSAASVQTSDLQAKCDSLSGRISSFAALLCLALACNTRLFLADLCLGSVLCLQGLWALQTGLSLYVVAFIPEGCHRLLDVVRGVEALPSATLKSQASELLLFWTWPSCCTSSLLYSS